VISRSAFLIVLAVAALSAPAASAKSFGGVVRDLSTGAQVLHPPIAHLANLPYGGGEVLHANRTWLIFWQPRGSGLAFDPGYAELIVRFLKQVAVDSHKPTNVYSLSGQYRDAGGPAAYDSSYGGAVIDADSLPSNGCSEQAPPPVGSGTGWGVCLDDAQLQDEVRHVVAADRLPNTSSDIYFLVTPNGLGSCETSGPSSCALGGADDPGSYCGYHSASPDGRIVYAVIPYNAVPGHCQSGNPRPNSSTADPTISTLSHEHNEMITDPLGDAWINGDGNEDGDLCITSFGPPLGGAGLGAFNESIHGGHYYLQEEWSNDDGGCEARDEADPISFTVARRSAKRSTATFTAHAFDLDGSIVDYAWFFGDGRTGHARRIEHLFGRAGTYRVVLRTTDSAENWAYYARTVKVTRVKVTRR
jgi:PKD domain